MNVQIREDLKDDYVFKTDDGVVINNNQIYEAMYDDDDQMLIYIDGEYRKVIGIDFDIN